MVAHEKLVRTLLILDCLRGEDSTGIAVVDKLKGAEVAIAKQVGDPFQLFNHRKYDDAMRGVHRAIIGHNRYATVGGVNLAGAHPFENASLVGVHNGTLTNKQQLADAWKYRVDSENLYHHMDVYGLDDAIDTAEGAWSLVWWDKDEQSMNFLRNKERPMYIGYSTNTKGQKTNDAIYFASEDWMLREACWKAGVGICDIFETEPDVHYSIEVGDHGVLGKPVMRRMPIKAVKELPFRNEYSHAEKLALAGRGLGIDLVKEKQTTALTLVANTEGKVVVEAATPKKPPAILSPSDKSLASVGYDRAYLKVKNQSFELLLDKVDTGGKDYILCEDPTHPYKEIRVYPMDGDEALWNHIPGWVRGDVESCSVHENTPNKFFYRLNPNSLVLVDSEEKMLFGPGSGKINKAGFERLKLTCHWCASPLVFGEDNKFTKQYECFCPACAASQDVSGLVNFTN